MKTYVLSLYLFFFLILEGSNCKANDFNLGVDGTCFFRRDGITLTKIQLAYGGGVTYNIKEKNKLSLFCLFIHENTGLIQADPNAPGPNNQPLGILFTQLQVWYFSPTLMYEYRFYRQGKFSFYAGLGFNKEYEYKSSFYKKTNLYENEYITRDIGLHSNNLTISCEGNYQFSKLINISIIPFYKKNLTIFKYDRTENGISLRLLVSPF